MMFKAHGEISAHYNKSNRILYIFVTGPVNSEFFKRYETLITPIRNSINDTYWVSMVTMKGEAILPMGAIPLAIMSLEKAKKSGLLGTAIIFKDSGLRAIFKEFWNKLYTDAEVPHNFFQTEADVSHWLDNLLSKA